MRLLFSERDSPAPLLVSSAFLLSSAKSTRVGELRTFGGEQPVREIQAPIERWLLLLPPLDRQCLNAFQERLFASLRVHLLPSLQEDLACAFARQAPLPAPASPSSPPSTTAPSEHFPTSLFAGAGKRVTGVAST